MRAPVIPNSAIVLAVVNFRIFIWSKMDGGRFLVERNVYDSRYRI